MEMNYMVFEIVMIWVLAIFNIVIFSILGYSVYQIRKSTYDFDKMNSNYKNN